MSTNEFAKYLLFVTLAAAAYVGGLIAVVPAVGVHTNMGVASVLLFTGLTAALFFWGKGAAASSNRNAFTNLISLSVFLKMALCIAFLLLYRNLYRPTDSWFVAIFLGLYVLYTIFEVWFMMKLARSSTKP